MCYILVENATVVNKLTKVVCQITHHFITSKRPQKNKVLSLNNSVICMSHVKCNLIAHAIQREYSIFIFAKLLLLMLQHQRAFLLLPIRSNFCITQKKYLKNKKRSNVPRFVLLFD